MTKKKTNKNTSGPRTRHFFITVNNPLEKGWTHEKLIATAKTNDLIYYVISDEVGLEKGTPHTHFFICYKNPKSLEKKYKDFEGCDVEEKHDFSTFSQTRDYVLKQGKYAGSSKEDTRVDGTQEEWGCLPRDRKSRLTNDQIEEKLEKGEDVNNILKDCGILKPQMEQGIRNYHMRLKDKEVPMLKEQTVVLHLGECDNYLKKEIKKGLDDFFVVRNYRNPWDTYQGEKILFLDRYKGQFGYGDFLNIIDNLKVPIDARYQNKKSLWTEVHIITPWTLNEILIEMVAKDRENYFDINEVLEKINTIVYHFKKGNHSKVLEIPAREFIDTFILEQESEVIINDAATIIKEIYYDDAETFEEEMENIETSEE